MMMLGLLALVALVVAGAVGPAGQPGAVRRRIQAAPCKKSVQDNSSAVSITTKCVRPPAKMFTSPHKTDDADLTHRPTATVSVTAATPPMLVAAADMYVSKNPAIGQAQFPSTLFRFPGGELLTSFQTTCDVCPEKTIFDAGRTFYSVNNGSNWTEVSPPSGHKAGKSCLPATTGNRLLCVATLMAIGDPTDNTTGVLRITEFEASGGKVRQLSVRNASTSGWPGLIAFDHSPGNPPNAWYMVQDGMLVQTHTGKWLLPMYGLLQESGHYPNPKPPWGPGPAHAPTPSLVTVLLTNTDASLDHWEFYSLVNDGQTRCNFSDARARPAPWSTGRCDPTESALVRLANNKILWVWRNDPGYNISLMAQVSSDEGKTFSLASPLQGPPADNNRWGESGSRLTSGPFGVEPFLIMQESGLLLLSTGRPRIYLWALLPGQDPLSDPWQPFDIGQIHNASRDPGGDVPPWPADFWTLWQPGHAAGCCTTSYTGLVSLPGSDELVMTYDQLATNCPKAMCAAHPKLPCGCNLIVSMKLKVTMGKTDDTQVPARHPSAPLGTEQLVDATAWWPPAIVVASGASAIELQAAQLLATWCGKLHAWGNGNNCQHCPLPIVTPAAAKGMPQFAVGVEATAALGLPASDLALDKLGVDGFVVTANRTALLRASAGSVALSGAPNSTNSKIQQGTIYAAYHLLRLLGVRFLAWDETLLPPSVPVLAQVEVDLTFVPHFEYRYTYGWAADYVPNPVPNADSPIHTQFHQSADPYVSPPGSVHTSYVLFGPDHPPGPNCTANGCTPTGSNADGRDCCPPADLFRQHPEWFWPQDDGKSDGQLCWSNASMVSYITEAVDDMLAQEKDLTQYYVVSISQVSATQTSTSLRILKPQLRN